MPAVTLDAIQRVRARLEVSIGDARAALIASDGDVDGAIARLINPEQLVRGRNFEIAGDLATGTGVAPPRGRRATIVTMDTSAAQVLSMVAPELDVFQRAVPPACVLFAIERRWDRFADGRTQLSVRADFRSPADTVDRIGAALAKQPLRRLTSERWVFEDSAGHCIRVQLSADDAVRIEVLVPSGDAAWRPLLSAAVLASGATAPTSAVRRWTFAHPDAFEVDGGVSEAVFTQPKRVLVCDAQRGISVQPLE